MKQKDIFLGAVAIMLVLLSPLSVQAQWVGPTQAPTGGNTSAPLNTGTSAQVKNGGLSVNAFTAWLNSYFAGNVGVGVVSPTQKLEVAGNVWVKQSQLIIDRPNTAGGWARGILYYGTDSSSGNELAGVGLLGTNTTVDSLYLTIADDPWASNNGVRILANGNVGVGVSPTAKLEVAGQVKITGGTPGAGKVLTSDAAGLATWTTPAVGSESDPTVLASVKDGIAWSEVTSRPAGLDDGDQVGITSEADTLATVTSRGATTNTPLTLNGNVSLGGSTRVAINGTSITSGGAYGFGNGAAWNNLNSIAVDTLETDGGVGGGGTLELNYYGGNEVHIGSSGSKPLRASIFHDGVSGYYTDPASTSYINGLWTVGSTRVDGTLDVNGNTVTQSGNNPTLVFKDSDGKTAYWHTNSNLMYLLSGVQGSGYGGWATVNGYWPMVINLTNNASEFGGNMTVYGSVTGTAFYYSSDKSLKKNIEKLGGEKSLENIKKLRGVSFDWKKDNTSSVGLIAQDVEEVYPELVKTDEKTGLKSVEYGNLVAPLIEAIKEQQVQIDVLKKEVEALKASR